MRPLSVKEMIGVWEDGNYRSPIDQALLLLHAGAPDDSLPDLAKLPVGERDRRLLELRERTIGSRLSCSVECPWCGEDLQFEFDTRQILQSPSACATEPLTATVEDISVTFRLPNTEDLVEALSCSSIEERRAQLLERCILEIRKDRSSLPVGDVPESAIQKICQLMASSDPQADVQFGMQCSSCNKSWQAPFDIGGFFWKEIAVRAQRALSEVHVLATAYGWSESDIFEMSSARREFYLQRVNA
jgi:hypothetical protein